MKMMQDAIVKQIKELAVAVIEQRNLELVDVELKGKSGSRLLRIFIDTAGGVTLDQCTEVSREIAEMLDRKDLIENSYRLEVSSPGIDRPLKSHRDFERNLRRRVRIQYISNADNVVTQTGLIKEVHEDRVVLAEGDNEVPILIESIRSAKILPVW